MLVATNQGGRAMKTIDEFGSVLVMAALVLGACAAADGLFLVPAADSARPAPALTDRGTAGFIAVVHQDRVVLADHSRTEPVANDVETVQTGSPQQARLSW
jgi:hypothetical protein